MTERIPFGKFGKVHGVKGEVRFWPFNAETEALKVGLKLYPQATGVPEVLTIQGIRAADKSYIVQIKELVGRDAVEQLTNVECSVDRDVLPPPADDEWYQADLVGLPVLTREPNGLEPLGILTGFVETPGPFDVMVVEGPRLETRLLVLWKNDIVESVDLKEGVVLGALDTWAPEGLKLRP